MNGDSTGAPQHPSEIVEYTLRIDIKQNFDPIQKPAASAASKAAAQTAAANLAHNLADMYFESTDSTDFVQRQLRRGRGR